MALAYQSVLERIQRLLNDPGGDTYSEDLIYDSVLAAHNAILPWVPKQSVTTLTSGSDGITLTLPTDCYQVQAVRDAETGTFLRKATMSPGTIRHEDSQYTTDWIEYPLGYLNLNPEVDEGDTFTLYYLAFWNTPSDVSDVTFVIEVPQFAHQGMIYYAAANTLIPSAVNSASIRQFNLRVDSGTPEDNPLKAEADYLLARFMQEMKLCPPYAKVGI